MFQYSSKTGSDVDKALICIHARTQSIDSRNMHHDPTVAACVPTAGINTPPTLKALQKSSIFSASSDMPLFPPDSGIEGPYLETECDV